MITKDIQISNVTMKEAHPAAVLVQLASQFESSVYIDVQDRKVNAKSIMGMMSLTLNAGDELTIITKGADEEPAMDRIEEYLCTGR